MKLVDIAESRGHKVLSAKLKDIESRDTKAPSPEQHICNLAPQLKHGVCTACRRIKTQR